MPDKRPASAGRPAGQARRSLAALLLTAMSILAALSGTGLTLPLWIAGAAAWLAGALLWPQLSATQRRQAFFLAAIGILAFGLTLARGGRPAWISLLTQNAALLGMLAAVGFLQLLGAPAGADEVLPRGKGALWRTAFGVLVLGSVINLSAVFIMAERIGANGKPTPAQAGALVRPYLAAALWSPFFAATAIAHTYAPGADAFALIFAGLTLSMVLLYLAVRETRRASGDDGASFVGYPMHFSALFLPGLLALLVALGHYLFPAWAALAVISLASLAVVCVSVVIRLGPRGAGHALVAHGKRRLPNMAGELALFLAAGVFAAGLTSLIATGGVWLPFARFGAIEAAIVLAVMIILAAVGIHTVISITMVAAWLAPLSPEPTLLALVFVESWAIGLAAGPMSGVHLAIQGRFGISAVALARNNVRYCAQAYAGAVIWLALVARFVGR